MAQRKPNGEVAELIAFVHPLVADGTIDKERIEKIAMWLAERPTRTLSQFELLRTTIALVCSTDPLTSEGKRAVQKAVENVLPREIRRNVKVVRAAQEVAAAAREKAERERSRAEKQAARVRERAEKAEARERNRVLYRANFMVAGVRHENREWAIRNFLRAGQRVLLIREPDNSHDPNAIRIGVRRWEGRPFDLGFVPREIAAGAAPIMDKPHKYVAECTTILTKGKVPIPVVNMALYGPLADIEQGPGDMTTALPVLKSSTLDPPRTAANVASKVKQSTPESRIVGVQPESLPWSFGWLIGCALLIVIVALVVALR
jgi:hypothetical protein